MGRKGIEKNFKFRHLLWESFQRSASQTCFKECAITVYCQEEMCPVKIEQYSIFKNFVGPNFFFMIFTSLMTANRVVNCSLNMTYTFLPY